MRKKLKDLIKECKNQNPNFSNRQISDEIGTTRRYVRKVLEVHENVKEILDTVSTDSLPDTETFYKLSLMTGLKKKTIPVKHRELLASLVREVENAIGEKPSIELNNEENEKEAVVLLLSDPHAGKKVYNDKGEFLYNKNICAYRFTLLKERVKKLLTEHLRLENFDEINILLLGDIIDGSGIYSGQELNQDLTCWSDQLSLAIAGIWDLVQEVKALGLKVNIFGVPGNHGRQGQYTPVNNNLDYIVLQMLYLLAYKEEEITVTYSTVTPYLNFCVKNFKFHIRHQAPPQSETISGKAKFSGWHMIHKYQIMCYAHLHHPANHSLYNLDLFLNGCFIGQDDLSESMATFSRPSQTMFGVAPGVGVSFRYNVYLDLFGEGNEAKKLLDKYPHIGVNN